MKGPRPVLARVEDQGDLPAQPVHLRLEPVHLAVQGEGAQPLLLEELPILAVTGANGFGGGKAGKEKLWTASIGLTAWMESRPTAVSRGGLFPRGPEAPRPPGGVVQLVHHLNAGLDYRGDHQLGASHFFVTGG